MQDFAFRNAVDIDSGRDFDHHMTGLIRWMDQVIGNTGASAPAVEADAATSAIPAAVSTESASEAASEEPRDLEIENLMRELAAAQQIMAELTRERDELRSKLQSHDRERPPEPRFSTGPSTEERLVAPAVNKPQPWSSSREAVARLTAGHNALNRSDYPEAMRQYLNAAEAGHPVAQYQIGVLYERGQGTARDLNAARAWYVRAAAQGHEDAKRQLERIGLGLLRY
jgi:hypothetical protein